MQLLVCIVLLSAAGLCVETADIVPESGTVVGGLEGTQDVSLYCAIRSGDIPLATNWFIQTPEDREAGGVGDLISADNENFILSGEALNINISGDITSVPSNTNLTIVSLTGDLQHVTILCISSQLSKLANFPLEVYSKIMYRIIMSMYITKICMCPCPWYTPLVSGNTWGL